MMNGHNSHGAHLLRKGELSSNSIHITHDMCYQCAICEKDFFCKSVIVKNTWKSMKLKEFNIVMYYCKVHHKSYFSGEKMDGIIKFVS